ncbi:MAG: efflux RND transporter periplasmic adaptor subunit [Gemmatimonadaceae bacterium]|nr:efflux RND transporter periplasmic adaptor subunit [Gemmatimonadaceae bacterium]
MNWNTERVPAARPHQRWTTAAAALSALALAGVTACGRPAAKAAEQPQVIEVGRENIAVAATGELRSGPAISGTLEPRNQATIRAEVAGPVVQTYVERGEPVRRGQLLLRIDDTALREAFLSAQSGERSAKLALDNAQRDLERNTALSKAGAIADRDLEAAQRALAAAQAAYADAQARLTSAQQQLDKTRIHAPFTGVVSDRPVNAGDVVQPGTALITVVDPTSMRLVASVPADQIGAIKLGAPVQFDVNGYPGRTFTGHIDRISPAADPTTRQVQIDVAIPNEKSALVAGLFAQGRVAAESRTGLVVPITAIDQGGAMPTAMRVKAGKVEKVPVEVGLTDQATQQIEVVAGLNPGDTLLVGAAQGITPGTPVRVITASDRTTAER